MATRREARERALQILFRLDLNPAEIDGVFAAFWKEVKADPATRNYAEEIVRGVREHIAEIDDLIRKYAEHWDLARMAVIDRNVLRMAMHEMLHRRDVPPVVSINEAVDIAKYFNSNESGRFVNGILDRVRKELTRPARTAEKTPRRKAGSTPPVPNPAGDAAASPTS